MGCSFSKKELLINKIMEEFHHLKPQDQEQLLKIALSVNEVPAERLVSQILYNELLKMDTRRLHSILTWLRSLSYRENNS